MNVEPWVTGISAVGAFMSGLAALGKLFHEVLKEDVSARSVNWKRNKLIHYIMLSIVFLVCTSFAIYGGYGIYKEYIGKLQNERLSEVAPSLTPAILDSEAGENSHKNIYIPERKDSTPDTFNWYELKSESLISARPKAFDYTKQYSYIYYDSILFSNRPGWSAFQIKSIKAKSIDLSGKPNFVFVLFAKHEDKLEIKLKDIIGMAKPTILPVKSGWGGYIIPIDRSFSNVDLNRVQLLQVAHSRHVASQLQNTFKFVQIDTR